MTLAFGLIMEPETVDCPACHGRGWFAYVIREADGSLWPVARDCGHCHGIGRVLRDGTPIERKRKPR